MKKAIVYALVMYFACFVFNGTAIAQDEKKENQKGNFGLRTEYVSNHFLYFLVMVGVDYKFNRHAVFGGLACSIGAEHSRSPIAGPYVSYQYYFKEGKHFRHYGMFSAEYMASYDRIDYYSNEPQGPVSATQWHNNRTAMISLAYGFEWAVTNKFYTNLSLGAGPSYYNSIYHTEFNEPSTTQPVADRYYKGLNLEAELKIGLGYRF